MGHLVVITGPIAAGKSTTAEGLARRLADDGRSVAVVDLDQVVEMIRAPLQHLDASWAAARQVHGGLVGAWLAAGLDVVIAHGPIVTSAHDALVVGSTPDHDLSRVVLRVPFAVARERVIADPDRVFSKDLEFLRRTHDDFAEAEAQRPPADWTFDTSTTSAQEIVDALVGALSS